MTTATHGNTESDIGDGDGLLEELEEVSSPWNGRRDFRSGIDGERLARALGWFGIGLGLAEMLAPRTLGRAIGLHRSNPSRIAGAALAVLGATALVAGRMLGQEGPIETSDRRRRRGIEVKKAITVARSPDEAYQFWRNFENLPRFMAHLDSVRVMDERRSYWKAKAPLGATVEWAAEITEDRPGELIAWRSMEGTTVPNSGTVEFVPAPGDRGTEVRVELNYNPPGGIVGATIAKLFGEEPSIQVDGDLRRFKQVLEVGEVVHSDASIHRGLHPAQPAEEPPAAKVRRGQS